MGQFDRLRGDSAAPPAAAPSAPTAIPRFAVIDVETTGLDPAHERIVEVAIVRADEHGRPIDHWTTRVNPGMPMRATHVHGITDADVADAPRFADLAPTISTALQGLVVVAHNAEFDVAFLQAEFARASLPMPRFGSYCTLQGSTLYLPQLRRRTLGECCAALGVPHHQAHSALGDAYAAAGLLAQYLALDARTGYDDPLTASRALHGAAPASGTPDAAGAPTEQLNSPFTNQNSPDLARQRTVDGETPGAAGAAVASPAPAPAPAPAEASAVEERQVGLSPAAIRAWARSQGITVGDRGRLKAELVAQYRAAMGMGGAALEPASAVARAPAAPAAQAAQAAQAAPAAQAAQAASAEQRDTPLANQITPDLARQRTVDVQDPAASASAATSAPAPAMAASAATPAPVPAASASATAP